MIAKFRSHCISLFSKVRNVNHVNKFVAPPKYRVRNAHLSPGLPTGFTRVNPGWVLSLILEKVGNTG